jgi:predicted anti-sigma-YlaC factor YlaD
MDCKRASRMMSLRLDGNLDGAEMTRLDEHLRKCSTCLVEWHRMQAIDSLLRATPMVHPPLSLRVQVMARLSRRDQARRAIIGGTALTLGTVTLALLILAPALIGLLNGLGIAPALISGGPETLSQLLLFGGTMGRAVLVLIEALALPLAALIVCSLLMALAVNSLWIRMVRRMRVRS